MTKKRRRRSANSSSYSLSSSFFWRRLNCCGSPPCGARCSGRDGRSGDSILMSANHRLWFGTRSFLRWHSKPVVLLIQPRQRPCTKKELSVSHSYRDRIKSVQWREWIDLNLSASYPRRSCSISTGSFWLRIRIDVYRDGLFRSSRLWVEGSVISVC